MIDQDLLNEVIIYNTSKIYSLKTVFGKLFLLLSITISSELAWSFLILINEVFLKMEYSVSGFQF